MYCRGTVEYLVMGAPSLGPCNPLLEPREVIPLNVTYCVNIHRRVRDRMKSAAMRIAFDNKGSRELGRTRTIRASGPNVVMLVREQWMAERTRRVSNFGDYVGVATEEAIRAGGSLHAFVPGKSKAGTGVRDLQLTIAAMDAADIVIIQRGSAMGNLLFLRDGAVVVAVTRDCTGSCESAFVPSGWIAPMWYTLINTGYAYPSRIHPRDPWINIRVDDLRAGLRMALHDWNASVAPTVLRHPRS